MLTAWLFLVALLGVAIWAGIWIGEYVFPVAPPV
jgi:hypothetical protein